MQTAGLKLSPESAVMEIGQPTVKESFFLMALTTSAVALVVSGRTFNPDEQLAKLHTPMRSPVAIQAPLIANTTALPSNAVKMPSFTLPNMQTHTKNWQISHQVHSQVERIVKRAAAINGSDDSADARARRKL